MIWPLRGAAHARQRDCNMLSKAGLSRCRPSRDLEAVLPRVSVHRRGIVVVAGHSGLAVKDVSGRSQLAAPSG